MTDARSTSLDIMYLRLNAKWRQFHLKHTILIYPQMNTSCADKFNIIAYILLTLVYSVTDAVRQAGTQTTEPIRSPVLNNSLV